MRLYQITISDDFIALAFLTAQKAWPELTLHTKGAMRNGLTEIEIREAVLQSMIYLGAPVGLEAMRVTEKAINEFKAQSGGEASGSKDERANGYNYSSISVSIYPYSVELTRSYQRGDDFPCSMRVNGRSTCSTPPNAITLLTPPHT